MKRLASLMVGDSVKRSGKEHAADATDTSSVIVELVFAVDATGQANITGNVKANVIIQCQPCMQPMNWQIDEQVSLAIVRSEKQAEQLPSYYEPLIVGEDSLSLSELVEDELLLALPSVALHDPEMCQVRSTSSEVVTGRHGSEIKESEQSERKNPFAVLEQLRKKDQR